MLYADSQASITATWKQLPKTQKKKYANLLKKDKHKEIFELSKKDFGIKKRLRKPYKHVK